MNENSLLEGLYNSMSDMALVLAEAFGLTEARKAAKLYAQGKLSPEAARKAGVMAANRPGGERAVKKDYEERGIDPEDAKKFAKNRAQSAKYARKPGMSPTSQATPQDLARGMRRRKDGKLPTWLRGKGKAVLRASADRFRSQKLAGEKSPKKPDMIKTNPK